MTEVQCIGPDHTTKLHTVVAAAATVVAVVVFFFPLAQCIFGIIHCSSVVIVAVVV